MNNKKLQVALPLLLSIAMSLGMFFGYKMRDGIPGKNFFSTQKAHPIEEVLELIRTKYVDEVPLGNITDTAINAILNKLDPHSVYITPNELGAVNEEIAGNFFGIGVEFNLMNDTVNITNIIPDGPGFKAGLKVGDQFLKVSDSLVSGRHITPDQIRKLLRGDINTQVQVQVRRDGKSIPVVITRDMIPLSSVDAAYMIDTSTGYIRINKFSRTTYREFMQAMEKLKKAGLQQLILDLRNNGGGILDEATSVADEFLDGDKLITYTEGLHTPKKEYRCKRPGLFETGKLVVLADEGTASASEILIGALQDWDRATIVGRRTFGKGLVQEQFDLSNGSALRLTIARYYTPIGRSIQRPYDKGEQAYFNEIRNRFHDGEVNNADSVKNDTSKTFTTIGGRKVFGKGGISPDYFIPLDTSLITETISNLYRKSTISDFSYLYYLRNTAALSQFKSPAEFKTGFTINEEYWSQFAEYAKKDSIPLSSISPAEKTAIINRLKVGLARQIWRTEGYYELLNTSDAAIQKSLEIIHK